jgi:hypothetical protein
MEWEAASLDGLTALPAFRRAKSTLVGPLACKLCLILWGDSAQA